MAGRRTCRRTTAACTREARAGVTEEREEQREMPMCRHVHPLPSDRGVERQLCELQRLMCEQTRMLSELLRETRGRNG